VGKNIKMKSFFRLRIAGKMPNAMQRELRRAKVFVLE
jgi:hypothetical protein